MFKTVKRKLSNINKIMLKEKVKIMKRNQMVTNVRVSQKVIVRKIIINMSKIKKTSKFLKEIGKMRKLIKICKTINNN